MISSKINNILELDFYEKKTQESELLQKGVIAAFRTP